MLMHYIPEVTAVHATEDTESGDNTDSAVKVEQTKKKTLSYEERLAAAGIPFSD